MHGTWSSKQPLAKTARSRTSSSFPYAASPINPVSTTQNNNTPRSQECFNSPYGAQHFPVYAEKIGYVLGQTYDVSASTSESVKMLSSVAKETGSWLIGGTIPEKADDTFYNTCTVYSPKGRCGKGGMVFADAWCSRGASRAVSEGASV